MSEYQQPVEVRIGGEKRTVSRLNVRKALAAMGLLKQISKSSDEIAKEWRAYTVAYARENVEEVPRALAHLRWPPTPLVVDDQVQYEADGKTPIMVPSALDKITDQDWEKSGNVIRLPAQPSIQETIAFLFPLALDLAEEKVLELMALFLVGNDKINEWHRAGNLWSNLHEKGQELAYEAGPEELIELSAVVGEVIDGQVLQKARDTGDRLGKTLRMVGLGGLMNRQNGSQTTQPDTPTSSSSTSSTERDVNSQDGDLTTSSPATTENSAISLAGSTSS
jgi:hypothetical protein